MRLENEAEKSVKRGELMSMSEEYDCIDKSEKSTDDEVDLGRA